MLYINRFCDDIATTNVETSWRCDSKVCEKKQELASTKVLGCGHLCLGVTGEDAKFPCLEVDCPQHPDTVADADDFCVVCYDVLRASPCVKLSCSHIMHADCLLYRISVGRPG